MVTTNTAKCPMRQNLTVPPKNITALPIDERGYPVPWFVAWTEDGKPEFRAMDPVKFVRAIKEKLCWVCGNRLGVYVTFVAGPMCGINRTSSEPPSHLECARWSAVNCPFLNNPRMVRREDDTLNRANLEDNSAGFAISRNPGVSMLWTTRTFDVFRPDKTGGYLITMGTPEQIEWYAEGHIATRTEVEASIESGIHNLEVLAAREAGGLEHLTKCRIRLEQYLPNV
jgi:hypothetical protein